MHKERFKEIYDQYHRELFTVIYALVKDHQTAEDLTQDTFFALYIDGLRNIREPSKIKYWLFKTAKHKTLNYFKRNQKMVPISPDFFNELGVEENLHLKIEEEETAKVLDQAMGSLSKEQKTVLILYYFNQMPQAAIAETLKIPLGTVKSRLNKARRLIQLHLQKEHVAATAVREEEALNNERPIF
jgi:RNA polymerase sigma-70 factor (ECF subfamily)